MALAAKIDILIGARTKAMEAGFNKATDRTRAFTKGIERSTRVLRTFGAALAGGGFALLLKSQFKVIDATAKAADKLGIATDKLIEMRHAAEITGVANNTLDMALQRMTRRLSEAAQGTGEAVKAIKELGLDAGALAQASPDQAFRMIAEAMESVENQGDKVRLAFKFFDSEGVSLVNTLGLGAKGLDEMAAEAERLGITFNRLDALKIEQANDAITRMRAAFTGFFRKAAIDIAPLIEAFATDLTGSIDKVNEKLGGTEQKLGVVGQIGHGIADGFFLLEESLLFVEAGLRSVIAGIADLTSMATKGLADFLPDDTVIDATARQLEDISNGLDIDAAQAWVDAWEHASELLPSEKAAILAKEMEHAAFEAERTNKAIQGMGQPLDDAVNKVEALSKKWQKQIDQFGKSSRQKEFLDAIESLGGVNIDAPEVGVPDLPSLPTMEFMPPTMSTLGEFPAFHAAFQDVEAPELSLPDLPEFVGTVAAPIFEEFTPASLSSVANMALPAFDDIEAPRIGDLPDFSLPDFSLPEFSLPEFDGADEMLQGLADMDAKLTELEEKTKRLEIAENLTKQFQDPLEKFREEFDKIASLEMEGLITPEISTAAIEDMVSQLSLDDLLEIGDDLVNFDIGADALSDVADRLEDAQKDLAEGAVQTFEAPRPAALTQGSAEAFEASLPKDLVVKTDDELIQEVQDTNDLLDRVLVALEALETEPASIGGG